MKRFEEGTFNIPQLKGISRKTIEEHVKLYAGYVKHATLILEHIDKLAKDSEKFAYELGELQRRFSFEFNGMRNHEYYFKSFEGGSTALTANGPLSKAITEEWVSFDAWLERFKAIALTRGIGWAMLYYDPLTARLLNQWVDEQHMGQLNGCKVVLALDMWEHSYVLDYTPSGKKNYVEDFFANVNWHTIEHNLQEAKK